MTHYLYSSEDMSIDFNQSRKQVATHFLEICSGDGINTSLQMKEIFTHILQSHSDNM